MRNFILAMALAISSIGGAVQTASAQATVPVLANGLPDTAALQAACITSTPIQCYGLLQRAVRIAGTAGASTADLKASLDNIARVTIVVTAGLPADDVQLFSGVMATVTAVAYGSNIPAATYTTMMDIYLAGISDGAADLLDASPT